MSTRKSKTYSVVETAELIGVSKTALYECIKKGEVDHLRPIRVGGSTRFPKAHIDCLLEGAA